MEAEGNIIIIRYTYRGEEGEIIPDDATHVYVTAKIVRAEAFWTHPNIVEVICMRMWKRLKSGHSLAAFA